MVGQCAVGPVPREIAGVLISLGRRGTMGRMKLPLCPLAVLLLASATFSLAAEPPALDTRRGDAMIAAYFKAETEKLSSGSLSDVQTLEDWTSRRELYRQQLREMLGLDPMPERTELHAEVTGRTQHEQFTVENVQFQSRPGLYVTGNLYVPKGLTKPAPAILYVCGHGNVKKDGISYGAKASYQHHGGWFARNGYVCLTIDTLQLGEIEGIHHGTHRYDMWWWLCRGYTPAGVEAWNCIRSLDYLQTRPEVDGERMGVTGRSGGGAYSWWIAALDERIKAAVPVAGITDLQNHVVDGCVEGHCDCMFMVNTHRWDYAQVAALVAPRPLLIANTDKDRIFPLDGVQRVHWQVRKIYDLYNAGDKLGLQISEGPHKDIQELQVAAFHWFNRFLKEDDPPVEAAAVKFFEPEQLKVFKTLPTDERNTRIQESFTETAGPAEVPADAAAWAKQRAAWMGVLKQRSFAAWPEQSAALDLKESFNAERDGLHLTAYDFTSQEHIRLRLYLLRRAGLQQPEQVTLKVLDDVDWTEWLGVVRGTFANELKDEAQVPADKKALELLAQQLHSTPVVLAYVAPRGVGPTAWDQTPRKQVQHRRRFMLLGQTLDGMRVWDVRRAIQAVRGLEAIGAAPLQLSAKGPMAGVVLYASLFEPPVDRIDLRDLPTSHQDGPYFLNVLRFLNIPQAVALAAERCPISIADSNAQAFKYASDVAARLSWGVERVSFSP